MSKEIQRKDVIYEEDLRKKFYTEAKVFWGKRKRLKLVDGTYYIYHTTLRITEDDIEVYDFDGGFSLCDFVLPKQIFDDEQLTRRIDSLLVEINWLSFYKDNMISFPLSKTPKESGAYRKRWKKEFLKSFNRIVSELMDLYNWYIDI